MATPDQSPLNSQNKAVLGKLFSHPANDTLSHLVRVLSTTAGVDSTLLLTGYSLTAVADQLTRFLDLNLQALAQRLASNASKSLLPGETVVAQLPLPGALSRIQNFRDGAKILSSMCSDVRAVFRLWGLLKIWLLARGTYYNPPKDSVLRTIAWGQILSISGYYVLEHGFYLAMKGVYKGWTPADIGKWFRTSIYIYGFYIVLDYIRLYREAKLEEAKPASEKMDPAKKEVADRQWYKTLQVNAGYTPLCFHWAKPGGVFNDTWVGLLGAYAGWASFKEAWKQTA